MPVQINEMIVRATVAEPAEEKGGKTAAGAPATPADKDEIVKECAALVLEILKSKNER